MYKLNELLNFKVVDNVRLFRFNRELEKFLNNDGCTLHDYYSTITINGIKYYSKYLLFNMVHDSSIYGVIYCEKTYTHGTKYAICGSGYDKNNNGLVRNIDTMLSMLNDEYFYID